MSDTKEPIDDGGSAFPSEYGPTIIKGMTLRQWYAGMALPGIRLTAYGPLSDCSELDAMAQQLAIAAFAVADAMIAEDRKGQE